LFTSKLDKLEQQKKLLVAEETILMRKAFQSDDPHSFIKAQDYYNKRAEKQNEVKSFMIDPYSSQQGQGYLSTPQKINDYTLRQMAKGSPIIKSIIETRVEQVRNFLEPQVDKYSSGFLIRKKGGYYKGDDEVKVTKEDQRKIHLLTEFLLRGTSVPELDNVVDDLGTWGEKSVKDALTLAKISTEIIYNRAQTLPVGFVPIDASTIYFANIYNDDGTYKVVEKNTKIPKYVQVIQGNIRNEYFDEEMMFAVRNSDTDMYSNGYGESELECLIGTVTAMLQGDAYNANIFKVGSAPTGIFRVQGNINESSLREFKTQWNSEMTGFNNHGRLAFLEADKMEFQDLSRSNRDMEYSKFQEYLIKLSCAVYKISPEEIGFTIQGGGGMFQDSGKERTEYSKDKGLKPLLRFLQKQINDKLINKIAPEFEFVFVGLDSETEERELEMTIKKMAFKGLKETREERGLPPEIDKDDVVLNPLYLQYLQMQQMGNPESDQFIEEEESDNPFSKSESWHSDSNPMAKEFKEMVKKDLIDK
jgi:hypothetical protein